MTQPLRGRGALVTGVGRRNGIGFAAAARLARMEANVCIHAWLPGDTVRTAQSESMEELLDELRGYGTSVAHISADLGDPDAPASVITDAAGAIGPSGHRAIGPSGHRAIGPLDILVAAHAHCQPDDAACLIAWLATDDSQWVSGQVINSRGGP